MSETRPSKTVITRVSTITLVEDRILVVRILPRVQQTIELAKANVDSCLELAEGRKLPLLIDLLQAQPLTPEVRQFYAGKEVGGFFAAIAIMVESNAFGRALGNFYLTVARTGLSKQLFHSEQKALVWLRTFCK